MMQFSRTMLKDASVIDSCVCVLYTSILPQHRCVYSSCLINKPADSTVVDMYDSASGTWTSSKLSVGVSAARATSVGNLAFFHGTVTTGGSGYVLYNRILGTWSQAALSVERVFLAATTVRHVAIFAGGSKVSRGGVTYDGVVDMYDSLSQTWSTAQLSVGRMRFAATSVGNLAIFAGGESTISSVVVVDAVDIYNSVSRTWSTAKLSVARKWLAAASVGDEAIFAGGLGGKTCCCLK